MGYQVGIDLGTTFTAAAVHRDGRSQIFGLGSQNASIPSVVLLREDETELTGEAAVRRALNEPERVAREFKRRLGDTTPIIVGGAPYSAEQLMARLLTRTITDIAKREGGAPERVAVTHPANWGPYKIDLLQQAVRIAGIPSDRVDLLTEPEAAAISYATQQRVEPGQVVAVYDLGGGTFDAAVLKRTENGFEIMGRPEGIERMGGIDFDAAVFAHVNRALEGKLQELDPEDPLVISGVARLREECVDAKIALSSDTDATIPVLLPNLQTEVRITRNEFESLIRPSLADSIAAMHRALESAGIGAADVAKVLLVGGSSRIPLISQMVSSELGRPVAVDADPKHAIALGAAAYAAGALKNSQSGTAGGAAVTAAGAAGAVAGAAGIAAASPQLPPTTPNPVATPVPQPSAAATFEPTTPMPEQAAPTGAYEPTTAIPGQAAPTGAYDPTTAVPQQPPPAYAASPVPPGAPSASKDEGSKMPLILGAVAAVLVLAVGAFVVFGGGGDEGTADDAPADSVDVADSVLDEAEDEPVVDDEPVVEDDPVVTEPTAPPDTTPVDTVEEVAVIDDATLQQQVAAVIGPGLAVVVADGVATLSGQTDEDSANAAVLAAQGVEGVTVQDEIQRLQADEICTPQIQAQERWVCIDSVVFDGTDLSALFTFDFPGDESLDTGAFHLHFFSDEFTSEQAGGDDPSGNSIGGALWEIWDDPSGYRADLEDIGGVPTRLCVEVANFAHAIPNLDSGTCFPVTTIEPQGLVNPDVEAQAPIRRRAANDSYVCTLD